MSMRSEVKEMSRQCARNAVFYNRNGWAGGKLGGVRRRFRLCSPMLAYGRPCSPLFAYGRIGPPLGSVIAGYHMHCNGGFQVKCNYRFRWWHCAFGDCNCRFP